MICYTTARNAEKRPRSRKPTIKHGRSKNDKNTLSWISYAARPSLGRRAGRDASEARGGVPCRVFTVYQSAAMIFLGRRRVRHATSAWRNMSAQAQDEPKAKGRHGVHGGRSPMSRMVTPRRLRP